MIEKKSYSLTNFQADVGGLTGLLLGASVYGLAAAAGERLAGMLRGIGKK